MFWGKKSDFYFGSKSLAAEFKVSLHANGRGYVGYHKPYFENKRAEGINIPSKTALEWKLPAPGRSGAVHVASLLLPSDYCRSSPPSDRAKSRTLVLGLEDGCASEIGLFYSKEDQSSLEKQLRSIGMPLVMVTLENGLRVAIVVRSVPFDPSVLPTGEQLLRSKGLLLQQSRDVPDNDNLNAMIWNEPAAGEALKVIDVGGVRWKNNSKVSSA